MADKSSNPVKKQLKTEKITNGEGIRVIDKNKKL